MKLIILSLFTLLLFIYLLQPSGYIDLHNIQVISTTNINPYAYQMPAHSGACLPNHQPCVFVMY